MSPFVIGIAGGSASGKSTVATLVKKELGDQCLLLTHDRYYHSLPTHLRSNPLAHNFDHPNSLDTARLVADMDRLRGGEPTPIPMFDFPRHSRAEQEEVVHPARIVIIEGILVMADPLLSQRFDVSLYVHAPDDIRLLRRIRRDLIERGRTVDQVLDQYEATVRPMHLKYVEPCRERADHELDGTSDLGGLVAKVLGLLPES